MVTDDPGKTRAGAFLVGVKQYSESGHQEIKVDIAKLFFFPLADNILNYLGDYSFFSLHVFRAPWLKKMHHISFDSFLAG